MSQRLKYLLSDVSHRKQIAVLLKVRLHVGRLSLHLHKQLKQHLGHMLNYKQLLRVISCGFIVINFGRFFADWLGLYQSLFWLPRLKGSKHERFSCLQKFKYAALLVVFGLL